MPRRLIRRWLPHERKFREHKHLRVLGNLLRDPNLWHLNRRSVSGAVGLGLFIAWTPIPVQMIVSATLAVLFRVNLPIAVVLVWITNPITVPPMFFFAYKVGNWMLGEPVRQTEFEFSLEWLAERLSDIWPPLLLGSLSVGVVSGVVGFVLVRLLWRLHVVRSWQERKRTRNTRTSGKPERPSSVA